MSLIDERKKLDNERNRLSKEYENLSNDYKNITEFLNLVKAMIKSEHPNMGEREVGMLAVNTINGI